MNLEDCRKRIDDIDAELIDLLNRRAALSREIGMIKTFAGLSIIDLHREDVVMRQIARRTCGDVSADALSRIYREILNESRRIQLTIAAEATLVDEVLQ